MHVDKTRAPIKTISHLTTIQQVDPSDLALDGWDISGLDLASAMERACVLEPDLKRQLGPLMRDMRPRRSIFDGAFIAANQVHNSTIMSTFSL